MERVRLNRVRYGGGVNPPVRPRSRAGVDTGGYPGGKDATRTGAKSDAFARIVDEQIRGPVLPYSRRTALLAVAARRGIGRFEANLIIATVQHRRGEVIASVEPEPPRRSPALHILAAGAIQSAIVLYGWWILG